MRSPFPLAAASILIGVLLALVAPSSRAAAPKSCPARAHTLAQTTVGRVWTAKGALYACTTVYGRKPNAVRLGPWRGGGKVAWDGSDAVWSVPLTRGGRVVGDRVYAADAEDGSRWLAGARAGIAAEARTQRMFAWGTTGGWVTRNGSVVFAQRSPQEPPKAVGTLPAAPVAAGKLVLVGAWPDASPTALGQTVKLDTTGDGDGDECGGSEEYRLTLVPDASGGARVGVTWWGAWERPFCG
ncbi:MAG TPA: hypothetical protein VFG42_17430 [Baekduia sp.]|uniref:hypothetical protein n=1 Tax=Baekduia sp. TaxID=2600305 RepID=UPI002D793BA9|nr:hypothetical protein [Baekduia sp.]HET6508578.1 hypothetical protein [Baekduia sp.]